MDYIEDDELCNSILIEVEKYIKDFILKYECNNFNKNEYNDILLFCSQLIDQRYEEFYKDDLIEIIVSILDDIRENTENFTSLYYKKMFGGIGQFAYSINIIFKKTGKLKNLSHSLNQYLLNYSYDVITYTNDEPTIFGLYDIISGISGNLYYILDCLDLVSDKENIRKIHSLISFLIGLSKDYKYKGSNVIKFHIMREQQYLEEDKKLMIDGHINFGLAHGIIGALVTLAKSKYLNYNVEGLDESIMKIFDLYEMFCVRENSILKYPTKLPLEYYTSGNIFNLSINSGWCYGNISIVRSLMKVCKYMGFDNQYKFYKKELLNIINQPIELYNLSSPIVCHGYSSVVVIQVSAYKETKDIDFLKTLKRNLSELLKEHKKITATCLNKNEKELLYRDLYKEDISLLEGSGGVILALINSLTFDLTFDKILLMD
ncbi:lanthionine synthetase LanC family protein [Clostridioides difficile]|nr:hypothetical protein KW95_04590 [Clostridioides difficile]